MARLIFWPKFKQLVASPLFKKNSKFDSIFQSAFVQLLNVGSQATNEKKDCVCLSTYLSLTFERSFELYLNKNKSVICSTVLNDTISVYSIIVQYF